MNGPKYNFYQVEQCFRQTLAHSSFFRVEEWVFHILINPGAGGFNQAGLRSAFTGQLPPGIRSLLDSSHRALEGRPAVSQPADVNLFLHLSAYPGHGAHNAVRIAEAAEKSSLRHMIISLGGDGTHHEVMNALHTRLAEGSHPPVTVFRFPLGSGNDAGDAPGPAEAWDLLLEGGEFATAKAVELLSAQGIRRYAFNIASIGIDAHIGMVTNVLKDKLPGNFYKLVADLSVPFYPGLYKIGQMCLSGRDDSGENFEHCMELGLLAMGVSGKRTYGRGVPILPDDRNICAIRLSSLFENIRMKKLLYKSQHTGLPFVSMFSSRELRIRYDGHIPFQLDGEVDMLEKDDFPLIMRVAPTGIQILISR